MSRPEERTALLIGPTNRSALDLVPVRTLVGRERELQTMTTTLRSLAQKARTLIVVGEPGVGKSALLREFLRGARKDATVVATECLEMESSLPFAPFRSLLDPLAALEGATEDAARVVGRQLDGIRPGGVGGVERSLIAAAWARLLSVAAAREPLLVAIDDLHWADHASLDLFAYLSRKVVDGQLLLVGTMRPHEQDPEGAVFRMRNDLRQRAAAVELDLGPLSQDGTRALVRAALALERAPDRDFVVRLHRHARGNALLVEEILHDLVSRGVVFQRSGGLYRTEPLWDEVAPRSVRSTVAHRLKTMTATTAGVLGACAVLGERFRFDQVVRTVREPKDVVVDALRSGIAAQLLEPDPGEDGTYRFRHALLRDALEEELLAPERSAFHARAAAILQGDASSAELAHHFDRAGDREQATAYHMRAALEAQLGYAFGDALRHGERVLDIVPETFAVGDFFVKLMPSVLDYAGPTRTIAFVERARGHYARVGDRLHYGRCLAWLGNTRGDLGDLEANIAAQREAIAVLEPLGDSIHLVNALANLSPWTEMPEALEIAERALAIADRTGAVRERARGREVTASALVRCGRAEEAHGKVREIVELIRAGAETSAAPYFLGIDFLYRATGILACISGTAEERATLVGEALSRGRARDLRRLALILAEAQLALDRGDWDTCLALGEEYESAASGALSTRFPLGARSLDATAPRRRQRDARRAHRRGLCAVRGVHDVADRAAVGAGDRARHGRRATRARAGRAAARAHERRGCERRRGVRAHRGSYHRRGGRVRAMVDRAVSRRRR